MTDDEAHDLGKRSTQAPAWEWRHGMVLGSGEIVTEAWRNPEGRWHLTLSNGTYLDERHPGLYWAFWYDEAQEKQRENPKPGPTWPDLRHGATRGEVLEVVRGAWRGTVWIGGALVRPGRLAWVVCGLHVSDGRRVNGAEGFDTEAEALLAALEAAPHGR